MVVDNHWLYLIIIRKKNSITKILNFRLDYASETQIRNIFKRFYPEASEEIVSKFTKSLPDNKLSMAKLQGHFLRNKNDYMKALETVKELIETNEFSDDMSISTWLFRLGVEKYSPGFLKEHIFRVGDLKGIEEGDLEKFEVKKAGHKKRIMAMIKGEDASKKAFQFMSKHSIRSFISLFLREGRKIEQLVSVIPENKVTEYHLKDIFYKNRVNLEKKVQDLLLRVDAFNKGNITKRT